MFIERLLDEVRVELSKQRVESLSPKLWTFPGVLIEFLVVCDGSKQNYRGRPFDSWCLHHESWCHHESSRIITKILRITNLKSLNKTLFSHRGVVCNYVVVWNIHSWHKNGQLTFRLSLFSQRRRLEGVTPSATASSTARASGSSPPIAAAKSAPGNTIFPFSFGMCLDTHTFIKRFVLHGSAPAPINVQF